MRPRSHGASSHSKWNLVALQLQVKRPCVTTLTPRCDGASANDVRVEVQQDHASLWVEISKAPGVKLKVQNIGMHAPPGAGA